VPPLATAPPLPVAPPLALPPPLPTAAPPVPCTATVPPLLPEPPLPPDVPQPIDDTTTSAAAKHPRDTRPAIIFMARMLPEMTTRKFACAPLRSSAQPL
jgi:hypothetical protein